VHARQLQANIEQQESTAMNSIRVGDLPIRYIDEGDGPPVILVHCSSGSHRMWRPLIDSLKGSYRVLAPDLIGYGRTCGWPAGRPYDVQTEAQILMLLASVAGEPAHFVGHSYGGALSLEAVRLLQGRARGMTLIEPVALHILRLAGKDEEWRAVENLIKTVLGAIARGDRGAAAAAYMAFWMGKLQWWLSSAQFKQNVMATMDKVALEFLAARWPSAPPIDVYASLEVPTLLIHGSKTRQAALAITQVLADLLPDVRGASVEGAGHLSPSSHAETVNRLIREHIRDCTAAEPETLAPSQELSGWRAG
jgi:pimeloyl-ACP methyl ester carboxylesterase